MIYWLFQGELCKKKKKKNSACQKRPRWPRRHFVNLSLCEVCLRENSPMASLTTETRSSDYWQNKRNAIFSRSEVSWFLCGLFYKHTVSPKCRLSKRLFVSPCVAHISSPRGEWHAGGQTSSTLEHAWPIICDQLWLIPSRCTDKKRRK